MNIKLSVIVLVYNTEMYLRDCLDSILNQTLDRIEIIIVNDESSDDSYDIIQEYAYHENVKVINQKNSGGAIAGNNGIKIATGEYVAIVDSDDIVDVNGYKKMYDKATINKSDICIGKPSIIIDGYIKEIIEKKERLVWQENKNLESVKEFYDIFYDGFYWNKIFRREFLVENNCFMPSGMLYADRPMVHRAYIYANRISIITDQVYFWRKRNDANEKSITQNYKNIENLIDKIESYNWQREFFVNYRDLEILNAFEKRNIERLLNPIEHIILSEEFRTIYIKETRRIFSEIENIYINDMGVIKNIYLYLLLENKIEELMDFINEIHKGKIVAENGIDYWELPYFRNKNLEIPDEIFVVKIIEKNQICINSVIQDENLFIVENIIYPQNLGINSIEIYLESKNYRNEIIRAKYDMFNKIATIEYSEIVVQDIYDIYIEFKFEIRSKNQKFRVDRNMLKESFQIKNSRKFNHKITETSKNNLSITCEMIEIENIFFDEKCFKFSAKTTQEYNSDQLMFYIIDRKYNNKIMLCEKKTHTFELLIENIRRNGISDFYYSINNKQYRMPYYEAIKFKYGAKHRISKIEIYATKYNNLSINKVNKLHRIGKKIYNRIRRKKWKL